MRHNCVCFGLSGVLMVGVDNIFNLFGVFGRPYLL